MFLHDWAKENSKPEITDSVFTKADCKMESYFIERNSKKILYEYDLQDINQLRNILNELWKDDEYMKSVIDVVCVSAIKNKVRINEDKDGQLNESVIPEYIYNF